MSLQDIYLQLESELMRRIALFFASNQSLLDDNPLQWNMKKLSDLGALTDSNKKLIARYMNITIPELNTLLEEQGIQSLSEQEAEMAKAAVNGRLKTAVPIAEDASLYATLSTFQANARDKLNLVNTSIVGNAEEKVKQVISQVTAEVLSGVSTSQQALTRFAGQFAEEGVPAYVSYKNNRQYSIEAYTQMVVRTVTNQVTAEMQMTRAESYGVDLIEISSHGGARPKCAPYQGRIYSKSGTSKKYPPLSKTSYGEVDGLAGINCGHRFYPYWEGKSRQTNKPLPKKENDRIYKESQKQRALERAIRHAKRERDFLKNANLPYEDAQRKVSNAQARMREFIDSTDRTRRYDRERVITN
ncbi:phage minor capsid protein [Niallia sp. RD1]|uniref:phage minor capsid protein n=1 Tax=Niallia sp. RD1 TaxID=2962858 RepID=UPI0020C19A84|nr:phage minor capsid protein [Niallia sp. RD1]UTI41112.1 phage minor capsid protein [Niallia sp. RD1]